MCKIKIRVYSIKYASDVSKKRKKHITSIEEEYNELCKKLDKDQSTKNIDKINRLKHEIDKWYEYQCKGTYVRSRQGGLSLKRSHPNIFFSLKRQKARKKLDCIDINGKIIKDDEKMLTKIYEFIANFTKKMMLSLISKTTSVIYNKFNVLSEEDANICEGKLTECECWLALKSMNLNKSPGSDGLSVELDVFGRI